MSKYSEDLEKTFKDVEAVKSATKKVIADGKKLALEKYHEAKSLERLKKVIKEK